MRRTFIYFAFFLLSLSSCGNHNDDTTENVAETDESTNALIWVFNEYSRSAKVALNSSITVDLNTFKDLTPDSLYTVLFTGISEISKTQNIPLDLLFNEIYDDINKTLEKRVNSRFGVIHSFFRIPFSFFAKKAKRERNSQRYLIKKLPAEKVERDINIRIKNINDDLAVNQRPLSSFKLSEPAEGQIVDEMLFQEIHDREAMEYAGALFESITFWIAFILIGIVTLIIGKNIVAFAIAETIATVVGFIINITIIALRSIQIEDIIYNHLVYNYWQYLLDSGFINQLIGQ